MATASPEYSQLARQEGSLASTTKTDSAVTKEQPNTRPLDVELTVIGPKGSGKTTLILQSLVDAMNSDLTPHGFGLAAPNVTCNARLQAEALLQQNQLLTAPLPASQEIQRTQVIVTRGKHALAKVTVADVPGSMLYVPAATHAPGPLELTHVEDHLRTQSHIVILTFPVHWLRGNRATLQRQQSYLHDLVQGWLCETPAPPRVVLSPTRIDELAPTLPQADELLDTQLVRRLFGKVYSLLYHTRPQPEWWVAPLSGFGFVPKQRACTATGEATWLLRAEPQPFNLFPLMLALLHASALRQAHRCSTPRERLPWAELCAALAADIYSLGGWLFRGDQQGHG